jgi:hypothetical protein
LRGSGWFGRIGAARFVVVLVASARRSSSRSAIERSCEGSICQSTSIASARAPIPLLAALQTSSVLSWSVPPAASGRLGVGAVRDAFFVVHESKAWDDWGLGFLVWHSSYFSICVWLSLLLMTAPRARRGRP